MTRRGGWPAVLGCLVVLTEIGCASDLPPEGDSLGGAEQAAGRGLASDAGFAQLIDDGGAEIVLEQPPTRILSLVPSATDILLALGEVDHLVGRTDYDVHADLGHLPSVGGGLAPSMERIVSLEPDIVVRFRGESDPATPRLLDARGIAHLAIRPDRVQDIRRIIGLLGSMVGEPERADSLRQAMDRELDLVSLGVAGAPRPRIVFLGGDPPSVAGPGTFLHELVEFAGGENAFADMEELYAPISLEEVLRRDVDLILAPEATPIPPALDRIPLGRVPLDVLTPGLQVGRSARVLATILHSDETR